MSRLLVTLGFCLFPAFIHAADLASLSNRDAIAGLRETLNKGAGFASAHHRIFSLLQAHPRSRRHQRHGVVRQKTRLGRISGERVHSWGRWQQ